MVCITHFLATGYSRWARKKSLKRIAGYDEPATTADRGEPPLVYTAVGHISADAENGGGFLHAERLANLLTSVLFHASS